MELRGGVCIAIGFSSGAVECSLKMPSLGVEQVPVADTPCVVAALRNFVAILRITRGFGFRLECWPSASTASTVLATSNMPKPILSRT
jgi:hypothetical protein